MCIAAAVVGGAVVGGVATAYSSRQAADAQSSASEHATDASIAEQRREFDLAQEVMSPYVERGDKAGDMQADMLGINGPEKQQAAIDSIQNSPEFAALMKSGETSILQNASATGGARGGNTAAALAQYRPAVLAQLINDKFTRLGTTTQLGQASAAGAASAALTTGSNISNAMLQNGQIVGNANAGAALARGQAVNNVTDSIGTLAVLKGLKAF